MLGVHVESFEDVLHVQVECFGNVLQPAVHLTQGCAPG